MKNNNNNKKEQLKLLVYKMPWTIISWEIFFGFKWLNSQALLSSQQLDSIGSSNWEIQM